MSSIITEKRCTKCGETKSIQDFYADKNSRDGYKSWCKNCGKEYNRAYSCEGYVVRIPHSEIPRPVYLNCIDCGAPKVTRNTQVSPHCNDCGRKMHNSNPILPDGSKRCSHCGVMKSSDCFTSSQNGRRASWCKTCSAQKAKEYRERRPEETRANVRRWQEENQDVIRLRRKENRPIAWGKMLERVYGITADDYWRMHKEQSGVCVICGRGNNGKRLHVDHDHATGKIRGLLCQKCNMSIGLLDDNPSIVLKMHEYLSAAKGEV
jgi:hypothetical protein